MTLAMTLPPAPDPSPQRRSFAALRHPGARAFLLSSGLAMMADNIEHVITYWVIFQKFGSPALGGFAVISHWLPFLLFSFYSGALADRFDPRRIIQLGMGLFIAVSLVWGILILTGGLQMWHAVVLLIIHGFAGVLWGPAGQMLIHDIVGAEQLQSGVRLYATSRQLGLLLGPAVGGGLMLVLGPGWGMLFNGVIYLPLVVWLWKAPFGAQAGGEGMADRPRRHGALRGFADIIPTVRAIAGSPTIVSMTLLAGAASLFVGNAHQAQMPEFTFDLGYGESGLYYSILLTAGAAGAVIAGIGLESRNLLEAKPKTAFWLVFLWCGAIAGFALSNSYALSVALLFAAGFFNLAYSSMAQTLVQLHAPKQTRGRVIGLFTMASLGLMTFSGLSVGIGGSFIGIHASLVFSAAALAVTTAALMTWTARRRLPAIR